LRIFEAIFKGYNPKGVLKKAKKIFGRGSSIIRVKKFFWEAANFSGG